MLGQHVAMLIREPGFTLRMSPPRFVRWADDRRAIVVKRTSLLLFGAIFVSSAAVPVATFGVIWRPATNFVSWVWFPIRGRLFADETSIWVVRLGGGSFPRGDDSSPRKSRAQWILRYRAGFGVTYSPSSNFTLDLGVGYSLQRSFDFERAGENYRTDPAPYFRLAVKTRF